MERDLELGGSNNERVTTEIVGFHCIILCWPIIGSV